MKLLVSLPDNELLNVSYANSYFTENISYWEKSQYSDHNIHYIEGIPLCSNDIEPYRLALFFAYSMDTFQNNALKLKSMETAIANNAILADVRSANRTKELVKTFNYTSPAKHFFFFLM